LVSASHAARCDACQGIGSHSVPVALVGDSPPARARSALSAWTPCWTLSARLPWNRAHEPSHLPSQDSPIGVWFNRGADYTRELQVVPWRAMHLVERIG